MEYKRVNINIPYTLYQDIEALAGQKGATVTEVFKAFLKLGLFVVTLNEGPNTRLVIEQSGDTVQVLFPF